MFNKTYWLFSYLGVMTVWASFLMGFRYQSAAPAANVVFNILLYAAYLAVHIVMTTPHFKSAVYGQRAGSPVERRIYVTIAVVTWVLMYWLHRPVGGFGWAAPRWLQYLGYCGFLLSFVAFFQTTTIEGLASFVGMPDIELSHTAGSETPLMTEGPYAQVRHPMYRAAILGYVCSLLIYPNSGQLLFGLMVSASFLGFIPFEERQLLTARGDEYRAYMACTPYRLFRGVW
jgi:protein-S-isoprenylcysteine O-methyltransferase Ste14